MRYVGYKGFYLALLRLRQHYPKPGTVRESHEGDATSTKRVVRISVYEHCHSPYATPYAKDRENRTEQSRRPLKFF